MQPDFSSLNPRALTTTDQHALLLWLRIAVGDAPPGALRTLEVP